MAETADMCPLSLAVDFFPRPSVLTVARTFLINSNLDPMEWMGLFGAGSLMRSLLGLSLSVMLVTACTVLPFTVIAQTLDSQIPQNQSVADVARRSREQKKNVPRQSRVITNDDLDREHFKPGQDGFNVGAPAAPQTGAASAKAVATEATDRASVSYEKESGLKCKELEEVAAKNAEIARLKEQLAEDAELGRLKEQLAEAQNQLTWRQRELILDQHTIYSNPNYTDDRTGQAKLASEQQRISETQQEIEALKGPIAELEWRQWRRKLAASSE